MSSPCERCGNVGCSFGCMKEQRDEIRMQLKVRDEWIRHVHAVTGRGNHSPGENVGCVVDHILDLHLEVDVFSKENARLEASLADVQGTIRSLTEALMQIACMTKSGGYENVYTRNAAMERIAREALGEVKKP